MLGGPPLLLQRRMLMLRGLLMLRGPLPMLLLPRMLPTLLLPRTPPMLLLLPRRTLMLLLLPRKTLRMHSWRCGGGEEGDEGGRTKAEMHCAWAVSQATSISKVYSISVKCTYMGESLLESSHSLGEPGQDL